MSAISLKCPNCGGDLRFDPATQSYQCEYCMSAFDQAQLEEANPQVKEPQRESRAAESDAEKTQETAQGEAVLYSCPSCGAEIVADATTAATFCYYCHNPVVLQGKLAGEYKPDLVIPFAIDQKEARESFLNYVKSKKFVPKDFFCQEQIEKISGIYFPFWAYDCKADGALEGNATKVRVYRRGDTEFTETKVYQFEREAELEFRSVTRNALKKENKKLVESVQPFRLDEVRDFSMGYLSGFQAEKRNIEKTELKDGLQQEIENHAEQMMRSSVSDYSTVNVKRRRVEVTEDRWKYLLLPVWVLTYRGGNGKIYYYAMNGQTKKICGVLPLDKKKLAALFFAIALPLMILLLIGGYWV